MAILDFFKKPKKDHKLRSPKKADIEVKKGKGVSQKAREAYKDTAKGTAKQKGADDKSAASHKLMESKFAWTILKEPHVTEKSTGLISRFNQYTFRIYAEATKPDIKHAINEIYGVHVEAVKKIKVARKQRRRGRQIGWRSGYTKAIVTLKKGEKIEVLPH